MHCEQHQSMESEQDNDILKLQRKERGEVIPEAKADEVSKNPGDTLTQVPQNNKAVLKPLTLTGTQL